MVDNLTRTQRSEIMARVGSKNTRPELIVRRHLHRMGFRYRLHVRNLPGKPDLVFPRFKAVVFVNGCFWHGHKAGTCKLARTPKTNVRFWREKVLSNAKRDKRNYRELVEMGWRPITVWECQIPQQGTLNRVARKIRL